MSDEAQHDLDVEWIRGDRSRFGTVRATLGDSMFTDRLDPTDQRDRTRFVNALIKRWPALDSEETRFAIETQIEQMGSREVDSRLDEPAGTPSEPKEISATVRPELFFTPDVAGVAAEIMLEVDGKLDRRLEHYIAWSDGRREQRELSGSLEHGGETQIWFEPDPSRMSGGRRVGWSLQGRQRWLDGHTPDPVVLFRRLCEQIAFYLEFPRDRAPGITAIMANWIILSYAHQAWDAVPYLYVGGPAHSGKSRLFEVLSRLVFRPLGSSNLTAASLFRTLHQRGGVLLLDEAERLKDKSPDAGDLRSILLSGYKKGSPAIRLEPIGDQYRSLEFDVFGPKALACIASLPHALATRCIPIMMIRASHNSEKPRRRMCSPRWAWADLRDDLHATALTFAQDWLRLAADPGVCPAMGGRQYELWQPLLAIGSWLESKGAQGLLELLTNQVQHTVEEVGSDEETERDEALLRVLADAVRGGERLTAQVILERVDDDLFCGWGSRAVGRRLSSYGFASSRSNGQRLYRGISLRRLFEVQTGYGFDLGIEDPDGVVDDETDTSITPLCAQQGH